MDLQTVKSGFDAFTSIDDVGLVLLIDALGQPLKAARTEVYYPPKDRSLQDILLDGPLELTFGQRHLLQVTDAHSGLCVTAVPLHGDPDHTEIPSQVCSLVQAASAIGETCHDIQIALESPGLHGNKHLTSGLIFEFPSAKIGIENFWQMYGTERSRIVIEPDWSSCKRLSLSTGKLLE